MVLNAAVQMIREAEELKQNILKFKSDTSMLQERSLWPSQQQLQKIYQKVLVLDLDYALDKKVEQDLWNVGFKQQIEALQTISKDRKNPLRSEAQAMLAWVLQAAAGFYLCLLHQICTAFKLDLPFRRRASLLGWVEGWRPRGPGASARLPPPAAARYICQHCLVHLGDLARYRQQPRVAYTFYRHALVVSTHSGQPYNQLALLARRRGRRLGALYWHVRAVLVRAPFPPAPANLLRTLQHASHNVRDQPVIPGVRRAASAQAAPAARLDAHTHVTELMRAMCLIHTLEDLEFAGTLVNTLNTSLTALVATDCFEAMTLIKMICVIIWLVHSATEELTLSSSALSASEATGAALSEALAAGALLALTLPAHTADEPPRRALPALKVYLQWAALYPQLLDSAPFQARPQIWHALAHTLNKLKGDSSEKYDSVPLPEDEELHGFQPLEESFKPLKFANHATWETYGRRVPDVDGDKETDTDVAPPSVVSPACLNNDPEVEAGVRAHRLIKLGKRLAELRPEHFAYTTEGSVVTFEALCHGGEQLTQALAELQAAAAPRGPDDELDSEDDAPLPAPVVISEADFREKVRDKRVGILKPQGSLERAREERALATNDDQDCVGSLDVSAGEDRRETRRPRVNIAMAAILRKQEETCKQVKFRTPPPVAEECEADTSILEATSSANAGAPERPRPVPPRQPKSLADIPVGRKTGGILALKDKSGYPHLVNVSPETTVRQEKVQYKDPKVIQPPTQSQKREPPKWHQPYESRVNKNYGLQNAGITYNPNYQQKPDDHGIRLSVVNPKEIDVRSAALQKQNARVDFAGQKSYHHQIGGDKKSFLEDLPPRFANQRFQEQQINRFRDDEFRMNLNPDFLGAPPPSWLNPMTPPLPPLQQSLPPGQLETQLTMPPPPLPLPDSFSPRNWWKQNPTYNPPVTNTQTHSQALQQLYSSQMSYIPPYNQMPPLPRPEIPPPGYVRQSPIGQQLPPRHLSPPNFNPYPPLPYPNMYETFPSYNRGFVNDRYQPRLDQGLDLSMSNASNLDLYVPTYESRRGDEGGLERAMDEALAMPLDLSKTSEPEVEEPPAPDPGAYSLFSGGPGSWGQMGQSQQVAARIEGPPAVACVPSGSNYDPYFDSPLNQLRLALVPLERGEAPRAVHRAERRARRRQLREHPAHARPPRSRDRPGQ